ncbi:MAG: glycosyltransferase, partial [Candidatus Promineifilaceae bacterium]
MEKVRVLQLINGVAIGEHSGGAESHALEVARLLDRSEYEPAVFAAWGYGSPSERFWLDLLASEGIRVEGLVPKKTTLRRDFVQVSRELWSMIGDFRPHIIHSHSERYDSLNTLMRIVHPARPKAVRTIQIDKQWQTHPHIGAVINSKLFPFLFHFEIAVSERIFQELQNSRFHKEDKIGLCYNGVDEAAFSKTRGPMPDYLPDRRPLIGIAARLSDQKGHA